jgi:RNA polymerase sigma factor (sigma-70 family)
MNTSDLELFEQARRGLLGIARRMLGSRTDAEDAVQDCFLRWHDTDRAAVASPRAWLATVCARRCVDVLRSADRSRVHHRDLDDEPIAAAPCEVDADDSASLLGAFVLLLERLTARERAAYVLHELFERPCREVAAILQVREAACQKLIERARAHVGRAKTRCRMTVAARDRLVRAFQAAIATGNCAQLAVLLAHDVRTSGRSGVRPTAALRIMDGGNHRADDSSAVDDRRVRPDRRQDQRAA